MTGATGPRVGRLILSDFRSYASLHLDLDRQIVVLAGPNGAGKTNILEALSLFAPGRGLRRADNAALVRSGRETFAVSVTVQHDGGEHRLGVGLETAEGRPARINRLDGLPAGSAATFADHLRLVWLTPDLDGLFRGTPGERRRFLDRLVLAVDAQHGARVVALDRALRTRNRLLEEGASARWLEAAERELAELAIAVAAGRRETARRLDASLATAGTSSVFPFARLALVGEFEERLGGEPALDQEDGYRRVLREGRARDAAAGRTLVGPHAVDLAVRHGPKDIPAEACSTGEQKALLLRLVLAHARLVEDMSGIAPLVLLDEVSAHLDPQRRSALYAELGLLGGQVWMTGADDALFAGLGRAADHVAVEPGMARVTTG